MSRQGGVTLLAAVAILEVMSASAPSAPETATVRPTRLSSLDALRGLAAAVVVLHHVALTSPPLEAAYSGRATGWAAVAAYTPLHALWAGGEAVLVFFVLSGLVLALPAAGSRFDWRAYYPRRLLRLYVPVWAALLLAVPQDRRLRPGTTRTGAGEWLDVHVGSGGPLHDVPRDAVLLLGSGVTDSALWSLQWEVWFSLLLPVFLLLWRFGSARLWALALGGCLFLTTAASVVHVGALQFLPAFGIGVLLARRLDRVRAVAVQAGPWLLVFGVPVLLSAWLTRHGAVGHAPIPVAETLGAALVVASFVDGPLAAWATSRRWVRWLGKRSFSLYLVHEPVVVTTAFLLGWGTAPLLLVLVVAVPVSLVLAEVFGRWVEEPAHEASKGFGRWAGAQLRRSEPLPVQQ